MASEAKLSSLQNLHASRGSTLLSFFRLHDEDSQNNLSTAILAALFNNLMFHETGQAVHGNNSTPNTVALGRASVGERMAAASAEVLKRYRDHMQRALLLTVKWNQPTFAKRILSDLPASHDHSRPIRKMLQHVRTAPAPSRRARPRALTASHHHTQCARRLIQCARHLRAPLAGVGVPARGDCGYAA